MKIIALLLFYLSLSLYSSAQSRNTCYELLLKEGKEASAKEAFDLALNKFNSARRCDPGKSDEIDREIKLMFDRIVRIKNEREAFNKQYIEAEKGLRLALKSANEARDQVLKKNQELGITIATLQEEQAKNKRIIDALYFYQDRFALATKQAGSDRKYGYINKNGDTTIDFKYDVATSFNNYDGFARVKKGAKKYLLDTLKQEYAVVQSVAELTPQTLALDLHDTSLDTLNFGTLKNSALRILLLYTNTLTALPAQIGYYSDLEHIDLRETNLTSLPDQIGELKNLQFLDLSNTDLTSIPARIGELKNLKELNLNNTRLKSVPDQLGELIDLKSLNLSSTRLTALPVQIGKLKNLKKLDLSFSLLKSLPDQIGDLTNLEYLTIRDTGLMSLPAQIGGLKNLRYLNLKNSTRLTSLPDQISSLTNLKELNVENCRFTEKEKTRLKGLIPWCKVLF